VYFEPKVLDTILSHNLEKERVNATQCQRVLQVLRTSDRVGRDISLESIYTFSLHLPKEVMFLPLLVCLLAG